MTGSDLGLFLVLGAYVISVGTGGVWETEPGGNFWKKLRRRGGRVSARPLYARDVALIAVAIASLAENLDG